MDQTESGSRAKPYWSPYLAGIGLGLTLLLTYVVMGHGLGASGAFTQATASLAGKLAPNYAEQNPYLAPWLESGFFTSWIVVEIMGVLVGGFLGGVTAGRLRWTVEKGARVGRGRRLLLALLGGLVVGFAARLAQGCTSGLALSGGAVLALGSWAFTLAFFAGGFGMAWFVRRAWQ